MISFSISSIILFIVVTVSTGYLPIAVSLDNITASVPSSTAFATSDTSALVGLGFSCIVDNISVAIMHIFSASLAAFAIFFWILGIFSISSSIPRSPLAIITPSLTFKIPFISSIAVLFSILLIICIWSSDNSINKSFTSSTSSWSFTCDKAK